MSPFALPQHLLSVVHFRMGIRKAEKCVVKYFPEKWEGGLLLVYLSVLSESWFRSSCCF